MRAHSDTMLQGHGLHQGTWEVAELKGKQLVQIRSCSDVSFQPRRSEWTFLTKPVSFQIGTKHDQIQKVTFTTLRSTTLRNWEEKMNKYVVGLFLVCDSSLVGMEKWQIFVDCHGTALQQLIAMPGFGACSPMQPTGQSFLKALTSSFWRTTGMLQLTWPKSQTFPTAQGMSTSGMYGSFIVSNLLDHREIWNGRHDAKLECHQQNTQKQCVKSTLQNLTNKCGSNKICAYMWQHRVCVTSYSRRSVIFVPNSSHK